MIVLDEISNLNSLNHQNMPKTPPKYLKCACTIQYIGLQRSLILYFFSHIVITQIYPYILCFLFFCTMLVFWCVSVVAGRIIIQTYHAHKNKNVRAFPPFACALAINVESASENEKDMTKLKGVKGKA